MPTTFEFDDITTPVNGAYPTQPSRFPTYSFTEDGIDFTLSAQSLVGNAGYNHNVSGNLFLSHSSATGSGHAWLLDAQAPGGGTALGGSFTGAINLDLDITPSGTWVVTFHGTNPANDVTRAITNVNRHTVTAPSGNYSHITFTESNGSIGTIQIFSLTVGGVNCFCAGTRIATPTGAVDVETLQPGDEILTADGDVTRVEWLGRQTVDTQLTHPAKVNPIMITAHALGDGLPKRDLMLSPDHAVALGGYLITAGAIVNGRTIYQVRDMPKEGFTYYHVETQAHELLLAEGCPTESYLDILDRSTFVNGAERADTPPIPEMDLPRISTARLVPEAIRTRLAERMEAMTPGLQLAS